MLRDEARYAERRARNDSFLHAGEWKQVKKEKDLTFYRRFTRGRSLRELAAEEELPEIQRAVERGYTSMICDGFVKGTIHDIMYGMTASSQDDLMTGFSYKDPPKDCVWIGSIETATQEEPFLTADLIWALLKLPPILDQVDVCYLKATGVKVDANGDRYGYLVLHSVHVAQCPPFAAHGISRAKMYYTCLFREPRPGMLKVIVRGIFDLSKKVTMLKGLVSAATTSILIGLLNGVGIGEAKKLTLLALRNRSRLRNVENTPKQSLCYMCCKRASFLGRANLFGTHLVTCYVCGGTVCNNCTRGVKHRVFLGKDRPCMKVECCPNCVREAMTTIHARPVDSEYIVVAEFYRNERSESNIHAQPSYEEEMKTNSSVCVPTTSTSDESIREYQLDFDDDPFSIALTYAEHSHSSGDDDDITLSPEPDGELIPSEIKTWTHRVNVDKDDFLPAYSIDKMHAARMQESEQRAHLLEQRLLELSLQADKTLAQTQETTMAMRKERDLVLRFCDVSESATVPSVISCPSIPFPSHTQLSSVVPISKAPLTCELDVDSMSPGPEMLSATEELRPEMAEDTSPIEKFPLSPGCFHPRSSQRQEFADIVRGRVDTFLADENRYMERRDQLLPPLDPHEWKQVQMSKQLRFFKRIRGGRTLRQLASEESLPDVRQAVENGYSTMICDGQVQGLMEDMMYGMTASSQEDLMTGFWYKNPPRDCVWLGTAEGPTPEDPFHSADFIWVFPKLTPYNVDICYLKATGVERDQDGKRYGYLVLHSVELPQCRPFEARGVSRAKTYFTCLFREIKTGYLNVTVRGIFDLGKRGKIAKKLVTAATKSFMSGLLNGVGIGLAKKLTLFARRNRDTLSFKKSECSICFKTKKKLLFGLDRQLLRCGVCKATICSSCVANTKQVLFLGLDAPISKRPCCSTCMSDARATCGILPGEPEFQVIADYYLRRHSPPSTSSNSSAAYPSPLPEMYPLDTMTRHRGSGRRRSIPMLKSNSSADMPTNSTADERLDTDPFSRELDEADSCFSDKESNSSIVAQLDPSSIMSSDSDKSTVVVWKTHRHDHDDDFVPGGRQRSEYEVFQLRLLQLNIQAENTLMQTQATARELRGAELD